MTDVLQHRDRAKVVETERASAPSRVFGPIFPASVRAFVRARETGLALVALGVGALSGLLVTAMSVASQWAHEILFDLPTGLRLSLSPGLPAWRVVLVVSLGGAALAALTRWAGGRFRGRLADAIEANALHGGRMSFGGSLFITAQTMISNGFGASVGLEAAYTQLCSACASLLGRELGARRNDMRLLVACGAAGAISAAFHAPLAGAFYGFEVVLGAYSVASLVPIAASAVVASLVAGRFVDHRLLAVDFGSGALGPYVFLHLAIVALICAFASVALMSAVARSEGLFATVLKPAWLRPIVGGALAAGIGAVTPAVLASGHGALALVMVPETAATALLALAVLKSAASAISLGSGFRGGLFFASLLVGALLGRCYGEASAYVSWLPHADVGVMAMVGLAGLGTGIVGAPFTMTCLALEMTGDFGITLSALIVSSIVSLAVRETFGYSFATWRFHLRGETIRGPHDIGWARDLRVARLMRRDVRVLAADLPIGEARLLTPVGAVKEIMLVDDNGYCGAVLVSDLHSTTEDAAEPLAKLAQWRDVYLTPNATIREALDKFAESEADVIAVVSDPSQRKVIGRLSEAHALRRYGEELERRNREFIAR